MVAVQLASCSECPPEVATRPPAPADPAIHHSILKAVAVPIHFERPITEPPVVSWNPVTWQPEGTALGRLRTSARRSLMRISADFLQMLSRTARAAGMTLPEPDPDGLTADSTPLLLTGHQPVIFHPGLVYKYQLTESVAASRSCRAVALIIDSDEGDPGGFEVPELAAVSSDQPTQYSHVSPLRCRTSSFSGGSGLYIACRLAPRDRLSEITVAVEASLLSAGCPEAATSFSAAASAYVRLPEELPMVTANTLVRRAAGIGAQMAELPLTTVCGLSEVSVFFSELLAAAEDFHRTYNRVLDNWRQQQGIRNDANPFPNLRCTPNALELPFWLLDTSRGTRSVAWLHGIQPGNSGGRSIGNEHSQITEMQRGFEAETLLSLRFAGQLLVPRGALITATLRLLFSDLFIHGLGGGRYDPATDQLIRQWWRETPPPFAVASASMCLFPNERTSVRQLQQFRDQYRDLQFNPGRYLDQPVFSRPQAAEIGRLLVEKQAAVEELQQHRSAGTSGRETGRRIQQLSDTIRSRVADILRPQLEAANAISEETTRIIESRTWPWFYFPELQHTSGRGT